MARTDRKPRRRLDPCSRRTAILEMAAKTFAVQPYNEVTISSIADSVGASSALVYRYFDGKEGLYAEVVRSAITNLMTKQADALAELPAGTPVRDQVQVASIVYLDHIASHPEAWATAKTTRWRAASRCNATFSGPQEIHQIFRGSAPPKQTATSYLCPMGLPWVHRCRLPALGRKRLS